MSFFCSLFLDSAEYHVNDDNADGVGEQVNPQKTLSKHHVPDESLSE